LKAQRVENFIYYFLLLLLSALNALIIFIGFSEVTEFVFDNWIPIEEWTSINDNDEVITHTGSSWLIYFLFPFILWYCYLITKIIRSWLRPYIIHLTDRVFIGDKLIKSRQSDAEKHLGITNAITKYMNNEQNGLHLITYWTDNRNNEKYILKTIDKGYTKELKDNFETTINQYRFKSIERKGRFKENLEYCHTLHKTLAYDKMIRAYLYDPSHVF